MGKKKHKAEEVDGAQQEVATAKRKKSKEKRKQEQLGSRCTTPEADHDAGTVAAVHSSRGDELTTYLSEVMTHFQTLVDDDEKQLLVANVMEEIAGKEQKAASDPVCSRHIEGLLTVAQPSQLTSFLASIMDTGGLLELAVRWVVL